jgi:hypothetical protein
MTFGVVTPSCRFQNTSETSERETAIDDDGLAIDHGGSDTQEHNHVSDVLRRAGERRDQRAAKNSPLVTVFRTPLLFRSPALPFLTGNID